MRKGNALYNAGIGIAGLVVASLAITLSVAMLIGPRQNVNLGMIKVGKIQSCKIHAEKEGFLVKQVKDSLDMRYSNLEDYREKLMASSMVIAQCEGFTLTNYCMGECSDGKNGTHTGVIMNLEYRPPVLK